MGEEKQEPMSDVEAQEYFQQLMSSQQSQHPTNMFSFLGEKVLDALSNIKSGFLTKEQIGEGRLTSIGHLGIINFCNAIKNPNDPNDVNNLLANYHTTELEAMHSTSLSKDGKLLDTSITQKRYDQVSSPLRKKNTGWFKKKQSMQPVPELQ